MEQKARIFIFPPSTDCELGNWLLKLYGIPVDVVSHTAPFFLFPIIYHGGESYPFVMHGGKKLSGIAAVFDHFELLAPEDKKLLPGSFSGHEEAKTIWEEWILKQIDMASAPWAYSYLLPHRNLVEGPITKGVPRWEKAFVPVAYPFISWLIRWNQGINADTPQTMGRIIRDVFDKVDARLSDGRQFLAGDRLTVADIGFAAAAAPVVLEPLYGYGGLLPDIRDVPDEMKSFVREMRSRPAGQFVSRIYRQFR